MLCQSLKKMNNELRYLQVKVSEKIESLIL